MKDWTITMKEVREIPWWQIITLNYQGYNPLQVFDSHSGATKPILGIPRPSRKDLETYWEQVQF